MAALYFSLLRMKAVSAFLHRSNPDHNFVRKRSCKTSCNGNHAERLCRKTSGLTPVITHLERASHRSILCMNGLEEQVSGPTGVQLILKSQFTITIILWTIEQISLKQEGNNKMKENQTLIHLMLPLLNRNITNGDENTVHICGDGGKYGKKQTSVIF